MMTNNETLGNNTRLVCCNQSVQPAVATTLLGLSPSSSYSVGDVLNGRISELGFWSLDLPEVDPADSVEMQLEHWLRFLRGKAGALLKLRESGYAPYIDCKAEGGSLSLCIEPEILTELGGLHVALSIWLYEQSPRNS